MESIRLEVFCNRLWRVMERGRNVRSVTASFQSFHGKLIKNTVLPVSTQNWTAWNLSSVTIGATVDDSNRFKRLFYIGTDRALHQIESSNNWLTWTAASQQNADIWPLADEPNAAFAITSSGATTLIFYISGGGLVETTLDNGVWQKAVAIFGNSSASATSSTGLPTPTSTDIPTIGTPSPKGSNTSAKVGAGVGVGVGVPAMAAIGVLAYLLWRRHRKGVEQTPIPEKDLFEVHGQPTVSHELGYDERQYELPSSRS
jgi:hypothetical protein